MRKIPKYILKEKMLQNKHERKKLSKSENTLCSIILFLLGGWILWLIVK